MLPLQLPSVDQKEISAINDSLQNALHNKVATLAGMTWEERFHTILSDLWHAGLKILVVVVIFVVGRWLIRKFVKWLDKIFEKRDVDRSLRTFVRSLVNIVLYLVLFYIVIAYLGVNTSLFVALFAAAGLAIGMALSGVFQNFAGGVMILLLKPFKVGDWIEAQNESGTVMDIRLFNTVLRTADNQTILIPNGGLSTSIIQNTNAAKTRRVEWIIALSYGDDAESAREVMTEMVKADPRVLSTPTPIVHFANLGASAIEFKVWCWVKSSNFWDVFYHFNAEFYKTLPQKGFNFPYSTLTVNLNPCPPPETPPAK
jgi:small conductance mechanosensitive channel